MADIRINALTTTATSSASDDFIAIDGAANGTRKLSVYSPTFGGNLIVSGTGTSSVAGNLLLGTTTDGGQKLQVNGNGVFTSNSEALSLKYSSDGGSCLLAWKNTSGTTLWSIGGGIDTRQDELAFRRGSTTVLYLDNSNNTKVTGNLTVSGTGTSSVAGNLLIGTTTDSANGKLQLATHTTSAGGIGFGTDVSLFRVDQFSLGLYNSQTTSLLKFYEGATNTGQVGTSSGNLYLDAIGAKSVIVRTNGSTTALTLDSSQNASFAGQRLKVNSNNFVYGDGAATYLYSQGSLGFYFRNAADTTTLAILSNTGTLTLGGPLKLANAYVAGAPAATGYVTIQDSSGTTYKVLVST
jgi:hypothetical protein